MTVDRRSFDPFAPAPLVVDTSAKALAEANPAAEQPPTGSAQDARDAAAQIPPDLDEISKDDLVTLAELADVATWGTKQQIADRIRVAAG